MKATRIVSVLILTLGMIIWAVEASEAAPIGTAITYQGRLIDANVPGDGFYDFLFKLHSALVGGSQVGSDINIPDIDVIDGYFTVELNFGSDVFNGYARWLEIAIRPGDSSGRYTTLSPRQEVTPVPYAIYAETAGGVQGVIRGSGTSNYIAKFTEPDAIGNSVIYESASNVGIGTTSPSEKLEVGGTVSATAFVGDGSGLTGITITETDPTVLASVKDGISWSEVSSRPAGLDDGDDVGITSETDPTVLASVKDGISWSEVSSRPAGLDDGDDVGITSETDPTVLASVKDGISWSEVTSKPAGFADNVDNTGITSESDPTIPANLKDGVSWSEVTSKPAGFADNVDNTGITSESDTLDSVCSRGSSTSRSITVNGEVSCNLGQVDGDWSCGRLLVDRSGDQLCRISQVSGGGGFVGTYGPNGNYNIALTALSGYNNHGYVAVKDSAGTTQAGMYVDSAGEGRIYADSKSFRVASLSQPGKEIWYTCPEGPEAAAYIRGTGHLTNGKAEVALPDYFVDIASPQGITVQLTPLSAQSKGLAVVEKAPDHFVIQELAGGEGTYDFDYMVMAVRKGYEDYQVIRSTLDAQAVGAPAIGEAGS